MLMPDRRLSTPAPSAGLVASLLTATWLDADPAGNALCCLFVAHPPAKHATETPTVVEQRMKRVAVSLGLGPADEPPPDIGPRLRPLDSTSVALRFDGTPYKKFIATESRWVHLLTAPTDVALILGLDPLSRSATPAEIDGYLDISAERRRLLFGRAHAE